MMMKIEDEDDGDVAHTQRRLAFWGPQGSSGWIPVSGSASYPGDDDQSADIQDYDDDICNKYHKWDIWREKNLSGGENSMQMWRKLWRHFRFLHMTDVVNYEITVKNVEK